MRCHGKTCWTSQRPLLYCGASPSRNGFAATNFNLNLRHVGFDMSLDSSLSSGGGLTAKRNVLTRAERISRMAENGDFDLSESKPIHLPKATGGVRPLESGEGTPASELAKKGS